MAGGNLVFTSKCEKILHWKRMAYYCLHGLWVMSKIEITIPSLDFNFVSNVDQSTLKKEGKKRETVMVTRYRHPNALAKDEGILSE